MPEAIKFAGPSGHQEKAVFLISQRMRTSLLRKESISCKEERNHTLVLPLSSSQLTISVCTTGENLETVFGKMSEQARVDAWNGVTLVS